MPPRESVYRRKFMTCLAGAEAIQDAKVKSVLLQIATGYKVMARHIEGACEHQVREDGGQQPVEAG